MAGLSDGGELLGLVETIFACAVGDEIELRPPISVDGCVYDKIVMEREMKSRTRPRLLHLLGPEGAKCYLLKREDVTLECVAMRLLSVLNQQMVEHRITYQGCLVQARTYSIVQIGTEAGLVEFVPDAVTLGRLKRQCSTMEAHNRVIGYLSPNASQTAGNKQSQDDALNYDKKMKNLVSSTVAYLVTNWVLGVGDGHEDNVMITSDGVLFRVDFGHVFGDRPELDSPVVWLPKAVTTAIGKHWPVVVGLCKLALHVIAPWLSLGSDSQNNSWDSYFALATNVTPFAMAAEYYCAYSLRWFAAMIEVDIALGTQATRYTWNLRQGAWECFREQLDTVDHALLKTIKNIGHDLLGYKDTKIANLADRHGSGQEERMALIRKLEYLFSKEDEELEVTLQRTACSLANLLHDCGDVENAAAWTLGILAQCEAVPVARTVLSNDWEAQGLLQRLATKVLHCLGQAGQSAALGILARCDVVPAALLRDVNALLQLPTRKCGAFCTQLRSFRVLNSVAGPDHDVIRGIRFPVNGGSEAPAPVAKLSFCLHICRESQSNTTDSCASGPLADPVTMVQMAALEALQCMEERGLQHVDEVMPLLEDEDAHVVLEAMRALCLMAPASPRNAYKRHSSIVPMVLAAA